MRGHVYPTKVGVGVYSLSLQGFTHTIHALRRPGGVVRAFRAYPQQEKLMKNHKTPRLGAWLAAAASVLGLSACVIAPVGPYHGRVHVDAVATVPVAPAPVVVVRPGWRGHPHYRYPHGHPYYR